MAPSRKTWLWILVAVVGFGVICIVGLAGFGMYFVSNHVHAGRATTADAFKAFDEAKARFKTEKPVYELDKMEHPRQVRKLSDMPTSTTKPENVWVLAWDPDRERLIRLSLPFWVLKLGRQKIDVASGDFDFQRLQLDVTELQRVGPVLLLDIRSPDGNRVVIWTQ